jgi:hypothetical protein
VNRTQLSTGNELAPLVWPASSKKRTAAVLYHPGSILGLAYEDGHWNYSLLGDSLEILLRIFDNPQSSTQSQLK